MLSKKFKRKRIINLNTHWIRRMNVAILNLSENPLNLMEGKGSSSPIKRTNMPRPWCIRWKVSKDTDSRIVQNFEQIS